MKVDMSQNVVPAESLQEIPFSETGMEEPFLSGWFFVILIGIVTAAVIAAVLIIGKMRLGKEKLILSGVKEEAAVRKRSKSLFGILCEYVREQTLFWYRYFFHPTDVRMLVKCAERYGKRRRCGRGKGETLQTYFERLKDYEEVASEAERLGVLAEEYYYADHSLTITKEEGKRIRKVFGKSAAKKL